MAVAHSLDQLSHEFLYHRSVQTNAHLRSVRQSFTTAAFINGQGIHVPLQIKIQQLHDEVKLLAIDVNDIEQADHVRVFHFLEKGNLADRGAGDALIFSLESDLLQGNDTVWVVQLASFVDDAVSS